MGYGRRKRRDPDDDDYAKAKKPVTAWDRTLGSWGRAQVIAEVCFILIWLGGVFPILLYQSPHPVAPVPELPPQAYDTIYSVDRAHWRMTTHFALLLALYSLMWGNGGEIGRAQFFVLFVVLLTDIYSVVEVAEHIYYDQHPSLKIYEMFLGVFALAITCVASVWYLIVYQRYHTDGVRFDGVPTDEEVFQARLRGTVMHESDDDSVEERDNKSSSSSSLPDAAAAAPPRAAGIRIGAAIRTH